MIQQNQRLIIPQVTKSPSYEVCSTGGTPATQLRASPQVPKSLSYEVCSTGGTPATQLRASPQVPPNPSLCDATPFFLMLAAHRVSYFFLNHSSLLKNESYDLN